MTKSIIDAADAYASAEATRYCEMLYGTSKAYTQEKQDECDEARAALIEAINAHRAAIIAELCAGVEMPEPEFCVMTKAYGYLEADDKYVTLNQMREAIASAVVKRDAEIAGVHTVLDADESKIIRNAQDGYPEGREPRELTLVERVIALCKYAADWKRWHEQSEAEVEQLAKKYEALQQAYGLMHGRRNENLHCL